MNKQRGSAMLVTLVVISALMAGGAALASLQNASTRAGALTKSSISSLYCAEAGLATARGAVLANYPLWNQALAQSGEPSWLAAVSHDIDGDGRADFALSIRDDGDELPPLVNDPTHDNNLALFVVSTCIKYPETPRSVTELVEYNGGGHCYEAQEGGCGGNANADRP